MIAIERLKRLAFRQCGTDVKVELNSIVGALWIDPASIDGQSNGTCTSTVGVEEIQESGRVRQVDDPLLGKPHTERGSQGDDSVQTAAETR